MCEVPKPHWARVITTPQTFLLRQETYGQLLLYNLISFTYRTIFVIFNSFAGKRTLFFINYICIKILLICSAHSHHLQIYGKPTKREYTFVLKYILTYIHFMPYLFLALLAGTTKRHTLLSTLITPFIHARRLLMFCWEFNYQFSIGGAGTWSIHSRAAETQGWALLHPGTELQSLFRQPAPSRLVD